MGQHCPHLGLQGDRHQVYLVPNPRHRCYLPGESERVAAAHQSGICLTSAYRRCPRLATTVQRTPEPRPRAVTGERHTAIRYPDLQAMPRKAVRRSLSCVEVTVLGLGMSIVLAACFVGYLLAHRLQVGPGMQAVVAQITVSAVAPTPSPSLVSSLPPAVPASKPEAAEQAATPTSTPEPVPPPAPAAEEQVGLPTSIPEPALPSPAAVARPPAGSPPTRLTIAKIGLDVPVVPVSTRTVQQGGANRTVWGDVPNAAGFHYTSAYPGTGGNTVINGHRDIQGAVFRNLHRLDVGDEIVLFVGELPYGYVVADILVVPETFASAEQQAENLRLIGPLPEERLTLITCTPVGLATHRLLVIARPRQ
jgi:sortase A